MKRKTGQVRYDPEIKWKARSMYMAFRPTLEICDTLSITPSILQQWKFDCEPDGTNWDEERDRAIEMALVKRIETQSEQYAKFGLSVHSVAEKFLEKLHTAVELWGRPVDIVERTREDGTVDRVAIANLGALSFDNIINPPPTLLKSFEVMSHYARLVNGQSTENIGMQGLGKMLKQADAELQDFIEEE